VALFGRNESGYTRFADSAGGEGTQTGGLVRLGFVWHFSLVIAMLGSRVICLAVLGFSAVMISLGWTVKLFGKVAWRKLAAIRTWDGIEMASFGYK
jgi:hypothetical protein